MRKRKKREKREELKTSNSSWTAFLSLCTNPVTLQSASAASKTKKNKREQRQPSSSSHWVKHHSRCNPSSRLFPFPGPILKAGHLLPLRDPASSEVHQRSCRGHLPPTAMLPDHCGTGCWGRILTPLLSEQGSSLPRGIQDVSYLKKQVWYAVPYTALPKTILCWLQLFLSFHVSWGWRSTSYKVFLYWDFMQVLQHFRDYSNLLETLYGEWACILVSASISENRGSISALILIPFSYNVDFPSQFPIWYLLNFMGFYGSLRTK